MSKTIYDELLKKFRAHFGREPDVVAYAQMEAKRDELLALIRGGVNNGVFRVDSVGELSYTFLRTGGFLCQCVL